MDSTEFHPDPHHRRSIRLPDFDYTRPGAYFVTIVCAERALLFEEPCLRDVAEEAWVWLAWQYPYVNLDAHVVMPNHLHGIIMMDDLRRGGSRTAPTTPRKPIGRLVGAFKTVSTKRINQLRGMPGVPVWQRNYYEHVIRDDEDLQRVRAYIVENPARWDQDPENVSISSIRQIVI